VAESTRLVDLVQADIDRFLEDREPSLASISPDLGLLVDLSRDLLRGGKRFRALFCYWGWRAVRDSDGDAGPDDAALVPIVLAATSLELFHAAALVHDDIMDNSDMRRGIPSAHRRFEAVHADENWTGEKSTFGQSAALLLGDLLLGWSDEVFDSAISALPSSAAARAEFNRMRTEVTLGQYLDILEERAWPDHPEAEQLARAHRVITYKSAKYSIEAPLAIGAALAGAEPGRIAALASFGLPLGIAYQLRDDLLGVFGDPAVTGKPAGDDLREGKRTVLVALARAALSAAERDRFDALLGASGLSDGQVTDLQETIRATGAVEEVERMIGLDVADALDALARADIGRTAREHLMELAETVTRRSA
jgi:geranylgeranyl diphosphate synthase type I